MVTINELLEGKSTVIKNKEFKSTREYIEPFLNKISGITDNLQIKVKEPSQVTTTDGKRDRTFNRVLIEGILPDSYTIDNHQKVLGFLYALDNRVPGIKMYVGRINSACTNFTVFNPEQMYFQTFDEEIRYSKLDDLVENEESFQATLNSLKNSFLTRKEETLGKISDLIYQSKLPNSFYFDMLKRVYHDNTSEYYSEEPSYFNILNALTQSITDDNNFIDRYERSYETFNLVKQCQN